MAVKRDKRGVWNNMDADHAPGMAAASAAILYVLAAAAIAPAMRVSGPLAGACKGCAVAAGLAVFIGVWGAVWKRRHPGERMTYRTGPASFLAPPLVTYALLVAGDAARQALHIGAPPSSAAWLILALYFGVSALLWRRFR